MPGSGASASSSESIYRALIYDKDILALAARIYEAVPEVPVQGCDIVREARTGKLFVLEANLGGNTWGLSSPSGREAQGRSGLDYYSQFDALDVVADELIKRTRAEAR